MNVEEGVERLAGTLLSLGVDEEFVADSREYLLGAPDEPGAWIEVAVRLRKAGLDDPTVATYDEALRRFPESHQLWSNRGLVLMVSELYEEALKSVERALEIEPDYAYAVGYRATIFERLQRFEEAVAGYRRQTELDPRNSRAWNSLGVCLGQLGEEEECLACHRKSAELDPEFTDPLFNLAARHHERGEHDEALAYVDRVLEFDRYDDQAQKLRRAILEREDPGPEPIGVRAPYERRRDPEAEQIGPRRRLFRPDGSRRSDEEVVREYGKIGLRAALLDEAVRRRIDSGETRVNYPLRLFLSYKWGTKEENAWVARLAGKLEERGWDIVFDGNRDQSVDRTVEELVSRLVTCRVFLAVATPAFVRHAIHTDDPTWVYDEYAVAMGTEADLYRIALAPDGKLAVPEAGREQMFRRSDTLDPDQMGIPAIIVETPQEPSFEEILPILGDDEMDDLLDEHLTYDGPSLSPEDRAEVIRELGEVQELGDDEAVARLRTLVDRHPFVFAAWRELALRLSAAGRPEEALEAVERGIEVVHPRDHQWMLRRELCLLCWVLVGRVYCCMRLLGMA